MAMVYLMGGRRTTTFTDDFNRANSTTSPGGLWLTSTASGQTPASTWGIDTNRVYCVSSPVISSTAYDGVLYRDFGTADIDLTVTFTVQRPGVGIVFRGDAGFSNWWSVRGDGFLWKTVAGSSGQIVSVGTITSGDVVRIIAAGTALTVYRNGTQIYTSSTVLNAFGTATLHGLTGNSVFSPTARYDDFSITY